MPIPVEKKSTYNSGYRTYLNVIAGVLGGGTVMLLSSIGGTLGQWLSNPQVSAWSTAAVSVALGSVGIAAFDRFLARSTSTVDQAYQEAWILPMADLTHDARYLVVQPHHKKRWGFGRDVIDGRKPFKILGVADSVSEAQVLCREETHQLGMEKDWNKIQRHYSRAMRGVLKKVQTDLPSFHRDTTHNLTSIWKRIRHHGSPPAFSAYRSLDTPDGPRMEFAPAPPMVCESPAAVTRYLRTHKLLTVHDKVLPRMIPDSGRLDDTPLLAAAWAVQSAARTARIPWTFVPLTVGPGHPARWVAACQTQTPNGQTAWAFFPPWPRSEPSADACRQALSALLPPYADADASPSPDVIRQVRAAWRQCFYPASPVPAATLQPRSPVKPRSPH